MSVYREKAETVRVEYRATSVSCDSCNKFERCDEDALPKGWVEFDAGHSDWGEESTSSDRDYAVCSWDCFVAVVDEVVEDYGERENGTLRVWVRGGLDYEFLRSARASSTEGEESK